MLCFSPSYEQDAGEEANKQKSEAKQGIGVVKDNNMLGVANNFTVERIENTRLSNKEVDQAIERAFAKLQEVSGLKFRRKMNLGIV